MHMIYMMAGILMGIAFLSLGLMIKSKRKRNKGPGLPPEIEKKILYMWQKHPNLLIDLELIFHQWNNMIGEKMREDKDRNERMESNRQFEEKYISGYRIPQSIAVTMESFILWSFFVKNYSRERSIIMDALLQNVCNKIVDGLEPEELEIIWQLDRKLYSRATDFILEMDAGVNETMEKFNQILRNGTKPADNN